MKRFRKCYLRINIHVFKFGKYLRVIISFDRTKFTFTDFQFSLKIFRTAELELFLLQKKMSEKLSILLITQ